MCGSESEWQGLVQDQASSDLSAGRFCSERWLGYASFLKWRRHLSGQSDGEPLSLIDLSLPTDGPVSSRWRIELDLGDDITPRLDRG